MIAYEAYFSLLPFRSHFTLIALLSYFSRRTCYLRRTFDERHNGFGGAWRAGISLLALITPQSFETETHVSFRAFRTRYASSTVRTSITLLTRWTPITL